MDVTPLKQIITAALVILTREVISIAYVSHLRGDDGRGQMRADLEGVFSKRQHRPIIHGNT
jgi:hypothetical protein